MISRSERISEVVAHVCKRVNQFKSRLKNKTNTKLERLAIEERVNEEIDKQCKKYNLSKRHIKNVLEGLNTKP